MGRRKAIPSVEKETQLEPQFFSGGHAALLGLDETASLDDEVDCPRRSTTCESRECAQVTS